MSNLLELREKLRTAVDLWSQVLLEAEEAKALSNAISFVTIDDYKHTVIAVINGLLVTANVTDDVGKGVVVDTAIAMTDLLYKRINEKEVIPSIRR